MALEKINWKQAHQVPERLSRKAKPNLSESVMADPGYEKRRSIADLVNIASGLPGAEIALAKGLGVLPLLGGVVKGKGGNWLSGSVEDALKGLKRGPVSREMDIRRGLITPEEVASLPETSINQWIEGPLTKYVKTRMASPEDEVRKLAEQGVLHYDPNLLMGQGYQGPSLHRMMAKEHGKEMAVSDAAKKWEDASDMAIMPVTYRGSVPLQTHPAAMSNALSKLGGEYAVANPDALAYAYNTGIGQSMRGLGFPHLIDELSNALNPASGLPRALQLTPEAVQNLSMEKAVRRVADINAWRAAQKVEANRKLAEQASLVREYAENNPKGLRWVELKATPKTDELGNVVNRGDRDLADQLKYEGDTMGHCVGGYCDDVYQGRSRIFSLRDTKGEPHVTVEVSPERSYGSEHLNAQRSQAEKEALEQGLDPDKMAYHSFIAQRMDELAKQNLPSRIVQIKGKQNRAPNEEYLPFVQDFVRNNPLGGQWSDVGDLGNTGLVRIDSARRGAIPYSDAFSYADAKALSNMHGDAFEAFAKSTGNTSGYIVPDEFYSWARKELGFASGGSVSDNLPQNADLGYNLSRPAWDIFGEAA